MLKNNWVFVLLAAFCTAAHAKPATVIFDGVSYELATVAVDKGGSGTITNEYVPEGESIGSWTTLLAVRYWPKVTGIAEATNAWVAMVRRLFVRDATAFAATGKKMT